MLFFLQLSKLTVYQILTVFIMQPSFSFQKNHFYLKIDILCRTVKVVLLSKRKYHTAYLEL